MILILIIIPLNTISLHHLPSTPWLYAFLTSCSSWRGFGWCCISYPGYGYGYSIWSIRYVLAAAFVPSSYKIHMVVNNLRLRRQSWAFVSQIEKYRLHECINMFSSEHLICGFWIVIDISFHFIFHKYPTGWQTRKWKWSIWIQSQNISIICTKSHESIIKINYNNQLTWVII
jgi:hypothetical protein